MKWEPLRRILSKSRAEMIRKVYEVDPLLCPKCGGRIEIVAPRSNDEALFSPFLKKWLLGIEMAKMERIKQAGSQCTLSKPLYCPMNGVRLRQR